VTVPHRTVAALLTLLALVVGSLYDRLGRRMRSGSGRRHAEE
jgi:hypothetical protein